MRIAICTDMYLPQLGGVMDSIEIRARTLRERGHTVHIYAPLIRGSVPDPDVTRLYSWAVPGTDGGMALVMPFGLTKHLRAFKPDIIDIESFAPVGLAAQWASWRLGIPAHGVSHGSPADYLGYFYLDFAPLRWLANKYMAWFFTMCDSVSAPSTYMVEQLSTYGTHADSIRLISNPIDTNAFYPRSNKTELKKKFGIGDVAVVVFGRIALEKHIDMAIAAFELIAKESSAQLVFIGSGPYQPTAERLVAEKHLSSRTLFLGAKRGQELGEAINACEVLLVTSRTEAQSMATLQALACGLPAVASGSGALPQYVRNGETGYTADPFSAKDFATKTIKLLNEPMEARRLGQRGHEDMQRFAPSPIAQQFESAYQTLMRI